jgi:hypothetical protein
MTAPVAVTQSAATSTALADDENLSSSLVNIEYSHWILPPPAELGNFALKHVFNAKLSPSQVTATRF